MLAIALIFGTVVPFAGTAEAHGYYRGQGCLYGLCAPVHAYTYSTPTYGHQQWGSLCRTVYIVKDWGNYVDINWSGHWYSC